MGKQPEEFHKTILQIASLLKDTHYAFRGTTSLILQEIDMNVDDIDILCDKATALKCNKLLKDHLVEKVEYSESEKFKSYYGKFEMNKIQIEIMGELQIKLQARSGQRFADSEWSKPYDASTDEITTMTLNGKPINVTTVETELSIFASMGRWNAYHKIKKQQDSKKQISIF